MIASASAAVVATALVLAIVRPAADGQAAPAGSVTIGSVRTAVGHDVRFWAHRYVHDGEARVSIVTTPGICNSAGHYGDDHILICDDGVDAVGWAFAVPVASNTARAEVTTENGQVVPLQIVHAPNGWPLGFAIGATAWDGPNAGVKLTLYDPSGRAIPIPSG